MLPKAIESKHILSDFQYGFRPDHSTTHQLLRVDEMVTVTAHRGLNMEISVSAPQEGVLESLEVLIPCCCASSMLQ